MSYGDGRSVFHRQAITNAQEIQWDAGAGRAAFSAEETTGMVVVATRPCQSLSLHAKPCVLQLIGNCSLILNRSAYHPHLDGLTARLAVSWLCDAGSCNTYPSRCELPDTLGTVCKQPRCKISSQAIFFLFFFLKGQYNIRFTILTAVSVWLNGIKQW